MKKGILLGTLFLMFMAFSNCLGITITIKKGTGYDTENAHDRVGDNPLKVLVEEGTYWAAQKKWFWRVFSNFQNLVSDNNLTIDNINTSKRIRITARIANKNGRNNERAYTSSGYLTADTTFTINLKPNGYTLEINKS